MDKKNIFLLSTYISTYHIVHINIHILFIKCGFIFKNMFTVNHKQWINSYFSLF